MRIPISRPILGEEEIEAVTAVLRSGMLAAGPKVDAFEKAFAAYAGTSEGIAVGSGTAALQVGLMAAGVGPGMEVIVPSFSFAATANVVVLCGAVPVFADIDEASFCVTADTIAPLITERTVGVMPVHLYGRAADMAPIRDLAESAGIDVYEDAAQAHGATSGGLPVGSLGRFAGFSFYPTKNMTTGEGGMITTSDGALAERARMIRNQGMRIRYHHELIGLNERMTEIEGAIGLVQLDRLPGWTEARQANAAFYAEHLDLRLRPPAVSADDVHVFHQYTIRPPDRDKVIAALENAGIGYGIYYPKPIHQQPPYQGSAVLPVTDRLAGEVLSIPVRPDLTEDERALVVETINGSLR